MKKIAMMIVALAMTVAAQAQYTYQYKTTPYHSDKYFIGASLTGLDLSYSGSEKFKAGVAAQVGYMVFDNVLVMAEAGMNYSDEKLNSFNLAAGGRYYIEQNGIFLGAKLNYVHGYKSYNDILPGVEVGYSFFLSRTVTIEPSIYYNQSFKKHSDFSNVGFKIGFGIYLND